MSLSPSTLLKILTDLVDSLSRQGIRKLVLLNGHGGNELKPLIRELHHTSDVFICICDWFRMAKDKYAEIFDHAGDHADEMETSMGLAYFPEFVKMDQAGDGAVAHSRFEAVEKGWVSITPPVSPPHQRHRHRRPPHGHRGEGAEAHGDRRETDGGFSVSTGDGKDG